MFKGLGRRVKSLLGRPEDLDARLESHLQEGSGMLVEEEELYLQLTPLTAALEEARTAGRAHRLHEASEHLLEHFHDRIRPLFFLHYSECELLRPGLLDRPDEANRLLNEAERVVRHSFAPLGAEEYTFSSSIDWFSDLRGGSWMFGPVDSLAEQLQRAEPGVGLPEGPLEVTWEFNRTGHFVDLGRTYWMTGHERFASEFIVQMVDWSERNPPLFGVNWLDRDCVAHRTLNWLLAMHLFLKSAQLTADVLARLLRSLLVHGLVLSRWMQQGKASLATASALHMLAYSLPELAPSKRWLRQSAAALTRAGESELNREGFHRSGRTSLHRQACEWLLLPLALHLLNGSHPPEGLAELSQDAVEALCHVRPPNALVPELGRAGGEGFLGRGAGPSEHTQRLVALAALALGSGSLARLAGEMPCEMLWWFGPSAPSRYESLPAVALPPLAGLYAQAGLAAVRDSWDSRANWCLLRGAPLSGQETPLYPPALPHDDLLTICLALEGEPVFIEAGGPALNGGAYRAFSHISSHNSVHIVREMEPLDLTAPHSVELEQRRDGIFMAAARKVWLDPERPLTLRREILLQTPKRRLAIRDVLEGNGEVGMESCMLLAPHLDVLMRGDMGCLLRGKRMGARIHPVFPGRFRYDLHKGRTQPFGGWHWGEAGRPVATQRLRYHWRAVLPCTTYLWIGWDPGDAAVPRAEELDRLFRS